VAEEFGYIKTFLPVVITAVSILGGVWVYWWQKRLDRENQILQERRELYRKFVGNAQLLQVHRKTESMEEAWEVFETFKILLAELLVSAPDNVVTPLKAFDQNITGALGKTFVADSDDNTSNSVETLDALVLKMEKDFDLVVAEMRKDSFKETKISVEFLNGMLRVSIGAFRI
jgi:hypothetical protein